MYQSPAKLLHEIGIQTESLRRTKKDGEKLSMYCTTPLGILKVYYMAAEECVIILMGQNPVTGADTRYFVAPESVQIVVRLEPVDEGKPQPELVIEGFKSEEETK